MAYHIEGSAKVLLKSGVFLNPSQVFNRDLTMLVSSIYSQSITSPTLCILEPLAATGLRSIRYFKELPKPVSELFANDIDPEAVQQIRSNFALNQVEGTVWQKDAIDAMHTYRSHWDIVDLDPYGSVASFLDSAVLSIKPGGLLCVTSTDMITLCGNNPDTCFYKYQSLPSKAKYCHEFALRILLYQLSATANKYQLCIEPLISLSVDFYVRVFVKVVSSAAQAKLSLSQSALVLQCSSCPNFEVQPLGRDNSKRWSNNYWTAPGVCPHCNSSFIIQGPIYSGPLFNKPFVSQVLELAKEKKELKTREKIKGVLNSVTGEIDSLLGWNIGNLCKFFKVPAISQKIFRSAVKSLGKEVSQSHSSPLIYKTSASGAQVFEIFKHWKETNGVPLTKGVQEGGPAFRILSKGFGDEKPNFDMELTEGEKIELGKKRFHVNEPNWGPKSRPKKDKAEGEGVEGVNE